MNLPNDNEDEYQAIKIEAISHYAEGVSLDIFLKLAVENFVKICNKEECPLAVLDKYKHKDVKEVYLLTKDYEDFVVNVRTRLNQRVEERNALAQENSASDVSLVKNINSANDVFKTIMRGGDFTPEAQKMAQTLTKGTLAVVNRGRFFEILKEFKNHCSLEYMHSLITTFVTSAMIDTFSWAKDPIKEKVALAAILCDLNLNREDFIEIQQKKSNVNLLSDKVLNHPMEVADMVAEESKFVTGDTLTIIKQHHERPNGKGFPRGLNYPQITVLTSIFIVGNFFVERLFTDGKLKEVTGQKLDKYVKQTAEKFYSGNYRKASDSLSKVFS